VIEKMKGGDESACARGNNPPTKADPEEVTLHLQGSFASALAADEAGGTARTLQVWYSDLTDNSTEQPTNYKNPNPPYEKLFIKMPSIKVAADGVVKLMVRPNETYTLTSLTTGSKGEHPSRTSAKPSDFPLPFSQNFNDATEHSPPKYWYDEMGSWEVQKGEVPWLNHAFDNGAIGIGIDGVHNSDESVHGNARGVSNTVNNTVNNTDLPLLMRHMVPVWPACWDPSNCIGPSTYFGPETMDVPDATGLTIQLDVKLEDHGNITLKPQCGWGPGDDCNFIVTLSTDGKWVVGDKTGTEGLDFPVGQWRRMALEFGAGQAWAAVTVGANATSGLLLANTTKFNRVGGFSLRLFLSRYIRADIDNFRIF
jgi:hypothetical protein